MYIIKTNEKIEGREYLSSIYIGRAPEIHPFRWSFLPKHAIQFENEEEAQATIIFIGAVIDWELEEQLEIISID